jgi:GNAT superfamily N-acetyltransferase
LKIRKANEEDTKCIAKVHIESWKTTYRGIIPVDYLNRFTIESRKKRWDEIINDENHFVFVAENENGEIVGFSSGGLERTNNPTYKGELYAIYILESYQRKGLGKSLIKPLLKHIKDLNCNTLLVWVLEDNKSRYFYEVLGGEVVGRKKLEVSGEKLNELAYGWSDISKLLKEI